MEKYGDRKLAWTSFHSTGGGRNNIHIVIDAMIERGIDPYINCCALSDQEWKCLLQGSYYNAHLTAYGRIVDTEAQERFIALFDNRIKSNKESQ